MTFNPVLWQEVTEIIEEMTGLDATSLTAGQTFDELGFDSLTTVEIAVAAEERLGARIPDERLLELTSIGDAVACIEELLAMSAPAVLSGR